jgi:hypothetical protein
MMIFVLKTHFYFIHSHIQNKKGARSRGVLGVENIYVLTRKGHSVFMKHSYVITFHIENNTLKVMSTHFVSHHTCEMAILVLKTHFYSIHS